MFSGTASTIKTGSLYAVLAYLGWGFFPIYWKFLKHVPYAQILCHRVVWSFLFYSAVLAYKQKKFYVFKPVSFQLTRNLVLASVLLMSNWLVYIYAVNSNQIVESSLGYFITPLVNIMFGVFLLGEKLSFNQRVATLLAVIGVSVIVFATGKIPWIAFFLAGTFSLYGLIKKTNPVPALDSNQFESMIVFPVALLFLLTQPLDWVTPENQNVSVLLLMGSGIVTGLPLLFFSAAAQRIPYYLMGFFQFIAPSIQFMSGVLVFKEPLSFAQLLGFLFIWSAGLLLVLNSWWLSHKK